MNTNKIWIITLGTLVLSIIIIFGTITYYNQRAEQAQISDVKQSILSFSQDHPANFSELSDFIHFCKIVVFSDIEGLKDKGIKGVACLITKNTSKFYASSNLYVPAFLSLDSITSFKPNRYIGISVDFKDIFREYNPTLLEEEELYFCSISEPSLVDPLILQLESKYDLFFDEGNISCSEIKMDETPVMIFLGFVPQAESLSIKQYLVDEQIASNVMNKQSFSEMKEILKDYPVIWQMEKPIIP